MSKILIKDLKINETVDSVFIVKQRQVATAKNGKDYVNFKLSDKTGDIEARMWDNFEEVIKQIQESSFIRVFAQITEYNGKKQLTIKKAKIAEETEYEIADFIRYTEKNVEQMFKELLGVVETFTDTDLKKLLDLFMSDQDFVKKYKKAPAAVSMHSACIGGLLEHTSNIISLALFVASEYPNINRDLLLTGVILHDMGKVDELSYETGFSYTDRGKLVGHITMGVIMLNEKINHLPDFPEKKKIQLEHMLLSHQGLAEFGSPKQPMTMEAVVLHQLDDLDAKIVGFNDFVELNRQPNSNWTPRSFMFNNRELYLDSIFDKE